MTGINLDLISDSGMYQFIEEGVRRKVSYMAQKHSKANNKHMESYDTIKTSKHLYMKIQKISMNGQC